MSIAPGLSLIILVARRELGLWVDTVVGGGGWFLALLIRLPILLYLGLVLEHSVFILVSCVFAGVFEEVVRYFVLKYSVRESFRFDRVVVIGLGWGVFEAFIVYAIPVLVSYSIYGYEWFLYMSGAIERNVSILFHVSLSFLVTISVLEDRLFLLLAICLHFLVDSLATLTMELFVNPWIVELFITLYVLAISVPVITYFIESMKRLEYRREL